MSDQKGIAFSRNEHSRKVQISVDGKLAEAGCWALDQLRYVLASRGWGVEECGSLGPGLGILIGLGESSAVQDRLLKARIDLPGAPESLVIHRLSNDHLVVAGRDELGLVYALMEIARAIELSPEDAAPFAGVVEEVGSPELQWRSMQLFLCNADMEAQWYFRESFWDEYLGQLARFRYNNLSLTFAHQTSYMSPPYPAHVELPEFPNVRVPGLTSDQRTRNLEMLRRISEMTRQRGLHFTLGVWSQHDCGYGPPHSVIKGLDESIRADCNALGLKRLLELCPAIDGVQFRMNNESGVPEDGQSEFYEKQFRAIAECGRPIHLDLRAKGLADSTIDLARRIVPDTVVSTKFWCEHMGMPYVMPALQDPRHSYRRYGTWDLLEKSRDWDLIHRLWSFGTQRILLWGGTDWVRRFVQSCHFGGAGFEVSAPLTNKGAGNDPGLWRVITDPSYQPYEDEYKRYWMFYLLFGRLGYHSDTPVEIWQRELRQRFGRVAESVGRAYEAASGVMPLLTVIQQWSASSWSYWPELFAGRTLEEDAKIRPSDPTQFYGAAEYVDDALKGNLCGKWSTVRTAEQFRELAADIRAALDEAGEAIENSEDAEFRGTELDLRITAGMADFHANRLVAGMHLIFYQRTKQPGRLIAALECMCRARHFWEEISGLADGIYNNNLTFDYKGHIRVHWKDRLSVVDADIRRLEEMLDRVPLDQRTADYDTFPGETVPVYLPSVSHDPVKSALAGRDLTLNLCIESQEPLRNVRCYHRPANQTLEFRHLEMTSSGHGVYSVTISGDQVDSNWDLMVFFEITPESGHQGFRWPDWRLGPPYFVIETHTDPDR